MSATPGPRWVICLDGLTALNLDHVTSVTARPAGTRNTLPVYEIVAYTGDDRSRVLAIREGEPDAVAAIRRVITTTSVLHLSTTQDLIDWLAAHGEPF